MFYTPLSRLHKELLLKYEGQARTELRSLEAWPDLCMLSSPRQVVSWESSQILVKRKRFRINWYSDSEEKQLGDVVRWLRALPTAQLVIPSGHLQPARWPPFSSSNVFHSIFALYTLPPRSFCASALSGNAVHNCRPEFRSSGLVGAKENDCSGFTAICKWC